ACGGGKLPPPVTPVSSAAFRAFVDDYFRLLFEFRPSLGTEEGFHEWDRKLEDLSQDAYRHRIAVLKSLLSRLDSLRKENLSLDEKIDSIILRGQIESELLEIDGMQSWRRNPIPYVSLPGSAIDALMKRTFAPAPERLRDVIERLRGVPAVLDAMRQNVYDPPRELTELALRIASGSVGFLRDSVADWAKGAAQGDAELLHDLTLANTRAVHAMESASHYLKHELLPRSRGSYAIGSRNYSRKLLFEELVDLPLDRLLEIGEANLRKDYDAFLETARRLNPKARPVEVLKSLARNHPSEQTLIPAARDMLEAIRRFAVQKQIVSIPSEIRPIVKETPPYARSGSFASMDTPGAYENRAKEAYYYITPPEPDWTPQHKREHLRAFARPVMDIISIHEAYPGHFVQFLYSRHFPTKTRKLTFCGTNVEGWAHYAEQMMVEEGFGAGDPAVRLAQLQEALVRDCRYMAGIKLHTQGWTVPTAARLFEEKAFLEPANAYEEARRGAYDPTYLYYTLGKLEIYKLREDYKRAKGRAYSLRDFHDVFIRQGGVPLPLMRQILLPGDKGEPL
ncbi:MAG: DUF885 domain-containing protein, partial [Acidobacteria bacterium]|nr:DUF885 domain-containing protein [Acidobacteriota bacterium]